LGRLSLIIKGVTVFKKVPAKVKEIEYDRKLAVIGKVQRVEPYMGSVVPILHRCLAHGETHRARPGDLLNGHGIHCCGNGGSNARAASVYDERLAKIGLCERMEPYQTRRKAIKHRCLRHGRIFLQEPRRSLAGRIPPCCGGMWRGSLYSMLMEPKRWGLDTFSVVYLFRLARFPGYVKIGITSSIKTRMDEEYGDFVCYWSAPSRFHAFLVEQATLSDASLDIACPPELATNKWAGSTEVRKSSSEQAINVIDFYRNELEEAGPHQFILDYLRPNEAERKLCEDALVSSTGTR
jgi:hypothetical protein